MVAFACFWVVLLCNLAIIFVVNCRTRRMSPEEAFFFLLNVAKNFGVERRNEIRTALPWRAMDLASMYQSSNAVSDTARTSLPDETKCSVTLPPNSRNSPARCIRRFAFGAESFSRALGRFAQRSAVMPPVRLANCEASASTAVDHKDRRDRRRECSGRI